MADGDERYGRAVGFGWGLARGQATAVVEAPWGFAVLHERFPVSQQHNRVVVTDADAPLDDVLDLADEVLGGAGLDYRRVDVEVASGRGLAAALAAATGAESGEELLLVLPLGAGRDGFTTSGPHSRGPHPRGDGPGSAGRTRRSRRSRAEVTVERVPFDAAAGLIDRSWAIDLPSLGPDERRQLVERVPEAARVHHLTQHTVSDDREPVALCHLLHDGATAQVEGVFTLPEVRGRGYATAVVRDAVALAAGAGCDLAFLFADADDWPQHLYRRLGFTDAGSTWTALWTSRGRRGS